LLTALQHAYETTDAQSTRYALGCIQLRGASGSLATTDGRQMLMQNGFTFGFEDEVLIRPTSVFGASPLSTTSPVFVGRGEKHFAVRTGPWTFYVPIDTEGRFPRVDDVIPRVANTQATVELHPADAAFLVENLPRLFEAFQQSPASQPAGRILGVEETLRGEFVPGMPDLLGRVDLIVEAADHLKIADWKTSRSRWSESQVEDAAEQLLCYAALAGDFAPGKPIRLEFAVLTKTKEVHIDLHQRHVEPRHIKRQRQIVRRVWQAIEAEHFYPAPSAMNCASCPYRRPCQAWSG
jgi:CRISPR/Cas system-associated exonuclease Cas4 (RecB family)